jgi:hypothetical protein
MHITGTYPVIFFDINLDMITEIPFKFPGKIFRSPMPFSSFDRGQIWHSYLDENIDMVVVLTETQEYLVYAGRDLIDFYHSHQLEVVHLPVPDFGIPDKPYAWGEGIDQVIQAGMEGKNVVIHCLAGLGRTGTFLACLAKEALGLDGQGAINWVRETIPGAMENYDQEQFVLDFDQGASN